MSIQVELQVVDDTDSVPDAGHFSRWASAAAAGKAEHGELSIRVVDEAESQSLNSRYRDRQYATNVLAFPVTLPDEFGLPLLGDLAICRNVIEREAREQGKETEAHWAHMVVHGTLHLLGYDHQTQAQAHLMESREVQVLQGLGYADPYAPNSATGEQASGTGTGAE
jgi:probable rRNA maturation factor